MTAKRGRPGPIGRLTSQQHVEQQVEAKLRSQLAALPSGPTIADVTTAIDALAHTVETMPDGQHPVDLRVGAVGSHRVDCRSTDGLVRLRRVVRLCHRELLSIVLGITLLGALETIVVVIVRLDLVRPFGGITVGA